MGAVESELENEYYEEGLANVNPSTVEFEYWVSIHNVFKEVYEIPQLLQDLPKSLASEALELPVGRPLEFEQCQVLQRLDLAVQTVVKAENFGVNCTKFSLQVLTNAHQAASFRISHEKSNASALKKLGNYASGLLTSKCEAEEFPFEFMKYKACILEVVRYMHFMLDFDAYVQDETSYLLMLQTFQKLFTKEMAASLEKHAIKLATGPVELSRAVAFLSGTAPLAKQFFSQAGYNGAPQLATFARSLGRIVIACCMTLHKNLLLDVDDTTLLLKAVTEGIILLDHFEPLGCFSEKVVQKLPSLVAVQTVALFANSSSNPEVQSISVALLCTMKTSCKMPKDTHPVIRGLFERVTVRARPADEFPPARPAADPQEQEAEPELAPETDTRMVEEQKKEETVPSEIKKAEPEEKKQLVEKKEEAKKSESEEKRVEENKESSLASSCSPATKPESPKAEEKKGLGDKQEPLLNVEHA